MNNRVKQVKVGELDVIDDVYLRGIESLYTWKILVPELLRSGLYSNALPDMLGDTLPNTLGNTLGNTLPDTLADILGDTLPDILADIRGDTLPDTLGDTLPDAT